MSDYRVTVRVRNARILRAIEKQGHTVASFCQEHTIAVATVYNLIAMKMQPVTKAGEWRGVVVQMCDALNIMPSDLFTAKQLEGMENNVITKEVDEEQLAQIAAPSSEAMLMVEDMSRVFYEAVDKLKPRDQVALQMHMDGLTLREIADELGLSKARTRQIIILVQRKIKHSLKKTEGTIRDTLREISA